MVGNSKFDSITQYIFKISTAFIQCFFWFYNVLWMTISKRTFVETAQCSAGNIWPKYTSIESTGPVKSYLILNLIFSITLAQEICCIKLYTKADTRSQFVAFTVRPFKYIFNLHPVK